jgi:hypoxanthine phosphoribosyltransferase
MNGLITIKDKQFKPFISKEKIALAVGRIAASINKELKDVNPLFLAVLNGSFVFAADLLREIKIPCEISFVKLSSYEALGSTGKVSELIGLKENVVGRTVVIIEDIVDSGITIETLVRQLQEKNAHTIKIATILMKPAAYTKKIPIDYIGFEIANDFVIGYGLDYDGQGRNLNEIHVLA